MPKGKHNGHRRGPNHYRWNDGWIISSHGYVKIRVPADHHLADPNGYAYEHQIVAELALGRPLRRDEVVHHINGNKADNRPENLDVQPRREHSRKHSLEPDAIARHREAALRNPAPRDPISGRFVRR